MRRIITMGCVLACCYARTATPVLAQATQPWFEGQPAAHAQSEGTWSPSDYPPGGQFATGAGFHPQGTYPAVAAYQPHNQSSAPPPRPPVELATAANFEPGPVDSPDLVLRLQQLEANQQRLEAMLGTTDEQNAPGAYYDWDARLPSYYYEPYYYDTPYVGARPLADYAPPGYTLREQQEGPGSREFTPLTPPPLLSPEQRDDIVTRGMYPGSWLVPGTTTSVRLRGFVRLAALYDFDPIGSPDSFVTNTIPVPQQAGQNYNMSGRISRFALETWTPTDFHDWNVHTFIEGDFFNGPAQAAGGGGNPFRLRHAFIDFGWFRFGQQNSTFMDGTNWPSLVDFQGPNSWTNQRQPSARMTIPLTEHWYWAGSVERSFSDITTNNLGTGVQHSPDLAMHLRYEALRGHLQVSGLLREIGFRSTATGEVDEQTASAVSVNAVFHPWAILLCTDPVHEENPSGLTRSRILLQGTWGRGLGRYMNDLAGQGLDGQVDPITGALELVDARGWNASYEHWFNEHWLTNFTYAQVNVNNNANQPGDTYDSAEYLAASLWWIPVPRLSFGVEYITGERENLNGGSARADRLHALAQYNF